MRKQLRTLVTLVAVVVSGLAIVAVAPAPPAAAWVTKLFTQGPLDVEEGRTSICTNSGRQTEASWFRRFHFGKQELLGAFALDQVRFGVDRLQVAPGRTSVPVQVRVYRYPADDPTLTWAELQATPYSEDTVNLAELPQDRLALAHPRTPQGLLTLDPETQDAVVEVHYAGNVSGERFNIGSNSGWQSADSSRLLPTCSEPEISPWSELKSVIALQARDTGSSDLDGDDIPDIPALDPCPRRAPGTYLPLLAGCPTIAQQVSATYDPVHDAVVGEVSASTPDGAHDGISCLEPTTVTLYDANTRRVLGTAPTAGSPPTYSWSMKDTGLGRSVFVRVEQRFHQDPVLGGLAMCTAASSQDVAITGRDGDLDGVIDAEDSCDTRKGTTPTAGCPLVARTIPPLELGAGPVSGVLKVADPATLPVPDACRQASEVRLTVRSGTAAGTYATNASTPSGLFAFPVHLTDLDEYSLSVEPFVDRDVALCGGVETGTVAAYVDTDGDGVRDVDDRCVRLPADGLGRRGCPLVDMVIDSVYAKGVMSGTLKVADPAVGARGFVPGPRPPSCWPRGGPGDLSRGATSRPRPGRSRSPSTSPMATSTPSTSMNTPIPRRVGVGMP